MLAERPIDQIRVTSYSRPASAIERSYYGQLISAFRDKRKTLGLTQEQLDQRLNLAEGQIAKWESFARLPGAFMLVCWGNALGLSILATAVEFKSTEEEQP